jgi:hypothetical protein
MGLVLQCGKMDPILTKHGRTIGLRDLHDPIPDDHSVDVTKALHSELCIIGARPIYSRMMAIPESKWWREGEVER